MYKNFKRWMLFVLVAELAACGGSGGGSNSSSSVSSSLASSVSSLSSSESSSSSSSVSSSAASSEQATETGVFLDSAVGGISYKTSPGMRTGVTNAEGEYDYVQGDTVIFYIGELEFPAVTAQSRVTPLDIAGSLDINNRIVVNIARLLQSLDVDGDASNGISIPSTAAAAAVSTVDFDVPVADFAALAAITNLVANSGSSTTSLISEEAAVGHLNETLNSTSSLIGSWVAGDGVDSQVVLTFIDSSHYVIMNDEDDEDEDGQDGVEYGTYIWDSSTGVISVETIVDTNGQWGLSHPCNDGETILSIENAGNGLLFQDSDESCGENNVDPQFTRVSSNSNKMVGSWFYQSDEELPTYSLFNLTILDDSHYMLAEFASSDSDDWVEGGNNGLERGTYTIGNDDRVSFEITTDTNGDWGFSDANAEETLTLDTELDELVFSSPGEDNSSLKRLGN